MWRASTGTKTFSGAYALMLAQGIDELTDRIQETIIDNDDIEEEDDFRFGHRAFDCLTLEQKIWTLHKAAYGLLDEKTPACELTAFLEATVASIFRVLEENIIIEIDIAKDYNNNDDEFFDDKDSYDRFYWRRIILNASKSIMENDLISSEEEEEDSDDDDDEIEEQLTVECTEEDRWHFEIECLENEIFWDADYDFDEFDDIAPDNAAQLKQLFGVHDTYFSSIPDDPSRPDALDLLKAINKLCNKVIKHEEKQLKKVKNQ